MTIAVDASGASPDLVLPRNRNSGPTNESCGGGIPWERGLKGLPRPATRVTPASSPLLLRVIESEIIPRLLLTQHDLASPAAPPDVFARLGSSEALARLVLLGERDQVVEIVEDLRESGVPAARIFLDLLAPIARKLGDFWDEDRCNFTEVTLGLSLLHQVVHEISWRSAGVTRPAAGRRAYFVPVPGEQHTFGVCMLEEFFLHAGWQTASDHDASAAVILRTVETQEIDIIGFSISSPDLLAPLHKLIQKTRAASMNPDLGIMLGGRLFSENPELTAAFDKQAVAPDAVNAVQIAEKLISLRPRADAGQTLERDEKSL